MLQFAGYEFFVKSSILLEVYTNVATNLIFVRICLTATVSYGHMPLYVNRFISNTLHDVQLWSIKVKLYVFTSLRHMDKWRYSSIHS